jgi:hypothetical protein
MEKSFFEYIGLADKEKIHSQIFAWLISEDCDAIDSEAKVNFINKLFDLKINKIITIETEKKNVDIVITTDCGLIVIENKIKSSQHSEQLNKYIEQYKNDHNTRFIFLTLIEEYCDEPWTNILYSSYYTEIANLEIEYKNHKDSIILAEYTSYLKNITEVTKAFLKEPSKFEIVFNKGKKSKITPINDCIESTFITNNKLETILQKAFLSNLLKKLKLKKTFCNKTKISETNGSALIDFFFDDINYCNERYQIFLEFQNGTIKFALCRPENSKVKNDANSKERYNKLKLAFGKLVENNGQNKKQPNLRKESNKIDVTEYISLSINNINEYWKKDNDNLAIEIIEYIENGKKLSKTLINLLNKDN